MTRLARMVIRVDSDLHGAIDGIADRLFMETAYDHSRAAVIRGLIMLGLLTVARNDVLAPLFAMVRVARGRKKGDRLTRP